ncbi:hypothetical protein V8C34DRAFT_266612 [Trichoderma compactum]
MSLRVVLLFADLLHRDLANRERQKQINRHSSTASYDSLSFCPWLNPISRSFLCTRGVSKTTQSPCMLHITRGAR